MSHLKSGTLLLLLAIPFALYAAWQVRGVTRLDFILTDPPSEKGLPTPEQLAAERARAEAWAGDVRKAVAVAFQFRPLAADDATGNIEVNAFAQGVAARSADLTDLEKFLSGVEHPNYTGALKERCYNEWQLTKAKLNDAEKAIKAWLKTPLAKAVDTPKAATDALQAFDKLVAEYSRDEKFSDSSKVAAWEIEARVKIVEALEAAGKKPYDEALALPLPFPTAKESKLIETALGAPAGIRDQVERLKRDLIRTEDAGVILPPGVVNAAKDATRRAREWAAKEELIALFADRELFTDWKKPAEWLPKVQAQFEQTQTPDGRKLIRDKVRQFCDAYIPKLTRYDSDVLIRGKNEPRSGVTIVYDSDDKEKPLTDLPDQLNEFNYSTLYKNFDQIKWSGGDKFTADKSALKPTPKTQLAREYALARETVTIWSPAAVNQLKMKCEGQGEAVQQEERRKQMDELIGLAPAGTSGPAWTKENSKIWTRLSALSAAMEKHPALFEAGP